MSNNIIKGNPAVAILMSTYNGEEYLETQINSILKQSCKNIHLYIRDDSSQDGTREILKSYDKDSRVTILFGESNVGYKNSFLKLLKYCLDDKQDYDYISFSDQDDVWLSNKIERAVTKLQTLVNGEGLYFSALQHVDQDLNQERLQTYKDLELTLAESFVRFSVSGATMVFSCSLAEQIYDHINPVSIYSLPDGHDSLVFRAALIIGYPIIYDHQSYILYRRHGGVVSLGGATLIKRIRKEFSSSQKNVHPKIAEYFLLNFSDILKHSYSNIDILKKVECLKKGGFLNKMNLICDARFRQKSHVKNIIFHFKLLFNKY